MSYKVPNTENASSTGCEICLSQEKILKTLEKLGLQRPDAQIFIFLGKKGPQRARDIAKSLRMPRQTLYRAIRNLQSKGIITATITRPAKFSAVPFERVLDLFVKAKAEEAHHIEQDKNSLLSDWQSIAITDVADQSPRFSVIEGRNIIYPRLKQMVEETKSQLLIISTIPGLMRADQFGLLDAAFNHASKTNTKFRFLTELTGENLKAIKLFLERIPKETNFERRTPEMGLKPISRMLIRDDAEVAFFVSQESDSTTRDPDDLCLWTNSNTIVASFKTVFEDLWHNSVSIEKRIAEIETGQPPAKTYVISDAEAAEKKYDDVLNAAKVEIAIMTSAAGLVAAFEKIGQLKERAKSGVAVKIMAPITRDNLDAAQRLSEYCRVKHVPASFLGTTIVDNQHLFQFKSAESGREKTREEVSFENVFYTNDLEYVEKTKSMFEEIWKHAVAPSPITVEQIARPSMPSAVPVPDDEYTVSRKDSVYHDLMEEIPGAVTEEYILNKMINAKRIPARYPWKDPVIMYGYNASAVLHLPRSFNLPDMCLSFFHFNKHSSSELEDYFYVSLWLETPNGMALVPVAVATDNPEGVERWKIILAGTPAGQNIHLLKKDELQVQLYGNTLFAGWTVSIPLFPPQYNLPPGGVLVEGYGKLKTAIHKMTSLSGVQMISEDAGFDAFVTFFHPDSKYSGPGTDGLLATNSIITAYPPSAPQSSKKPEPTEQ